MIGKLNRLNPLFKMPQFKINISFKIPVMIKGSLLGVGH